jgi:hypothetical protein
MTPRRSEFKLETKRRKLRNKLDEQNQRINFKINRQFKHLPTIFEDDAEAEDDIVDIEKEQIHPAADEVAEFGGEDYDANVKDLINMISDKNSQDKTVVEQIQLNNFDRTIDGVDEMVSSNVLCYDDYGSIIQVRKSLKYGVLFTGNDGRFLKYEILFNNNCSNNLMDNIDALNNNYNNATEAEFIIFDELQQMLDNNLDVFKFLNPKSQQSYEEKLVKINCLKSLKCKNQSDESNYCSVQETFFPIFSVTGLSIVKTICGVKDRFEWQVILL